MGTQNGHNVPFLEFASLKKRKRKALKRIKQIDKIFKKGNRKKKKSCHLVPKMVIDLPIEGSMKQTGNTEEGRECSAFMNATSCINENRLYVICFAAVLYRSESHTCIYTVYIYIYVVILCVLTYMYVYVYIFMYISQVKNVLSPPVLWLRPAAACLTEGLLFPSGS